ncbi:hypothetical protein F4824DRAFT_513614 [Ustulina deusta]|nr:hypothetical protein F4824DRAFT_513614 [Ustulina deusta]
MSGYPVVRFGGQNNQEIGQLQNQNIDLIVHAAPQPANHLQWWQGVPVDLMLIRNRLAGTVAFSDAEVANQLMTCIVCEEQFPRNELLFLRCGHWHCRDCLKHNVRVALASYPFNPAKCCLVIPRETLRQLGALSGEDDARYANKMEELTSVQGKMHCWDCGAFIPPTNRKRRMGECPQCPKKTCKACLAKSHWGPCDKTKLESSRVAEEKLYHLAAQKGWKRCPNCLAMVQKSARVCRNSATSVGKHLG